MKNPVFKAQVEALFEKTAYGQDPGAVAAGAQPGLRGQIHRGMALERGFADAAAGGDRLLHGAGGLAEKLLTGGSKPNGMLSRAAGGVSNFVMANPKAAIGTAAMLPILSKAFDRSQHRYQDELMNAYHDPTRVITASLDEFLEKKAASMPSAPFAMGTEVLKGLGSGIGASLAGVLAQIVGSHLSQSKNIMVDDPRRKALLETLFRSDPVIKDSLARHPDNKTLLLEAYGTMTKFAPSLSMDINATRSFLREAVLGGSGVNYASIKQIVDTEKSIADAKPKFGGKHK